MQFLKKGSDMASSIKSKYNSTKGIFNLLEFSYLVFTYAIKLGIAVVKSTIELIIEFASKAAVSTLKNLWMRLRSLRW